MSWGPGPGEGLSSGGWSRTRTAPSAPPGPRSPGRWATGEASRLGSCPHHHLHLQGQHPLLTPRLEAETSTIFQWFDCRISLQS